MRQLILIILISWTAFPAAYSQGCNDAGICTFGEFDGVNNPHTGKGIKTEISYIFGLGENNNLVNTIQLDQRFDIFNGKGSVFFRLPFTYVYGTLGQTSGLGDVTAGLDYAVYQKEKVMVSLTAGAKLPSNDANKSSDGKGLPMAYQVSLGTYDLLAGAGITLQTWRIGLAYQKPFGANGNAFLYDFWEGEDEALEYFESNELKRGDDVMLRLDKDFTLKNNSSLQASVLAVYRIQKDQIVKNDIPVDLEDSNGLTLNLSVAYNIPLKNQDNVRLLLAAPVITREIRADGLTRTFVFSLAYSFHY
jgi:hypothetical protein